MLVVVVVVVVLPSSSLPVSLPSQANHTFFPAHTVKHRLALLS
jgi:hypothetical protein